MELAGVGHCWGLWCKLGFCSCNILLQKKPVRESDQRQMSCSSSGSLSPSNQAANAPKQTARREWKYIASEKTASKSINLCNQKELPFGWNKRHMLYMEKQAFCCLTVPNLTPRQQLLVSGCAGRCAVCDLLARSQQPSDISLCHALLDEEPQLRGPARRARRATALTHALCSLRPGHRSLEWKIHCSRLANHPLALLLSLSVGYLYVIVQHRHTYTLCSHWTYRFCAD